MICGLFERAGWQSGDGLNESTLPVTVVPATDRGRLSSLRHLTGAAFKLTLGGCQS